MIKLTVDQKLIIVKQYLTDYAELTRHEMKTSDGIVVMYQIDDTLFFSTETELCEMTYKSPYFGKVLPGEFVLDNHILVIEARYNWNQIAEWYDRVMIRRLKRATGTRIYVDGILKYNDVPFRKDKKIRDRLLASRKDGGIPPFKELRMVDPEGKITSFTFPRTG